MFTVPVTLLTVPPVVARPTANVITVVGAGAAVTNVANMYDADITTFGNMYAGTDIFLPTGLASVVLSGWAAVTPLSNATLRVLLRNLVTLDGTQSLLVSYDGGSSYILDATPSMPTTDPGVPIYVDVPLTISLITTLANVKVKLQFSNSFAYPLKSVDVYDVSIVYN